MQSRYRVTKDNGQATNLTDVLAALRSANPQARGMHFRTCKALSPVIKGLGYTVKGIVEKAKVDASGAPVLDESGRAVKLWKRMDRAVMVTRLEESPAP